MSLTLSPKIIFFALILIATGLEIIGDIFFKKWSIESKNALLYTGLLVYFVGTIFWAISLKFEDLSTAISIFTVLNMILIVLVGVLVFNEQLTLYNKLGIALGVVSLTLMQM